MDEHGGEGITLAETLCVFLLYVPHFVSVFVMFWCSHSRPGTLVFLRRLVCFVQKETPSWTPSFTAAVAQGD